MSFSDLKLDAALTGALHQKGYVHPTPIQAKAIPYILQGRDIFGIAQTGTGKTAAFALPILQFLSKRQQTNTKRTIKALVLAPTRELATQIGNSFADYSRSLPLKHTVIFGGVSQNVQVNALRNGIDILVATPGRLLDLLNQKLLH
ncbi:MAG TPA: DEAD/DEAH box helicase, partial [Bacteroidia bacterium]